VAVQVVVQPSQTTIVEQGSARSVVASPVQRLVVAQPDGSPRVSVQPAQVSVIAPSASARLIVRPSRTIIEVADSPVIPVGLWSSLTADVALRLADNGRGFNNRGTAQALTATLPSSLGLGQGWSTKLCVTDAFDFTLQALGNDVLCYDGLFTGPGGSTHSSTKGSLIEVVYQNGGQFYIFNERGGPWDYGPAP